MSVKEHENGEQSEVGGLREIRRMIEDHPDWSRWRLSVQLARQWEWYSPKGQLRDMAVRALLLKFQARGQIRLPPRRGPSPNRMNKKKIQEIAHESDPILEPLKQLLPLRIEEVSRQREKGQLLEWLIHRYHYLSYRGAVGYNLKYLVWDPRDRPLACLVFSSAAWKCAARDRFIGWTQTIREERINWITNNSRFLILPWVSVKHLASHLLSVVLGRLPGDWWEKYAQPIHLVETFVDSERFAGTSYRAAGWAEVGRTQGRGRQDRYHRAEVSVKSVYVKGLHRGFQEDLCR